MSTALILGFLAIFLVLLVVGAIVGMVVYKNSKPKPELAPRRILTKPKRMPRQLAPRKSVV